MAKLIIKLGCDIRLFATSRTLRDIQYLGSVQRGIEIGALAINAEGTYLQINGDYTKALNKSQVVSAIAKAERRLERRAMSAMSNVIAFEPAPKPTPPAPVVVIVKKRRVIAR